MINNKENNVIPLNEDIWPVITPGSYVILVTKDENKTVKGYVTSNKESKFPTGNNRDFIIGIEPFQGASIKIGINNNKYKGIKYVNYSNISSLKIRVDPIVFTLIDNLNKKVDKLIEKLIGNNKRKPKPK